MNTYPIPQEMRFYQGNTKTEILTIILWDSDLILISYVITGKWGTATILL